MCQRGWIVTRIEASNSRPRAIAAGVPSGSRAEAATTRACASPGTRGRQRLRRGRAGFRVEVLLQPDQAERHCGREPGQRCAEGVERLARMLQIGRLAGCAMKREQVEDGDAVAAGQGVVERVFGASEQALVVIGGEEEASLVAVLEIGEHPLGQRFGFPQPSSVAGRLMKPEQAVDEEGVILQVRGELGLALAVRPEEASVGRAQLLEQEPGGFLGGLAIFLDLEGAVAVGVRGDHQAIPAGDDLVVEQGSGPFFPGRQQPGAERPQACLQLLGSSF